MPSEGYQKLVEHLQPLSATGRDYRSLADRMGYSNQYIQWLGSTHDPVMNLLREYRNNDRKISELTLLLKELERYDVVEDLQPYIGQWNAAWKLVMGLFFESLYLRYSNRIWQSSVIILLRPCNGWGGGGVCTHFFGNWWNHLLPCRLKTCCCCILAREENFAVSSAYIFVICNFGI